MFGREGEKVMDYLGNELEEFILRRKVQHLLCHTNWQRAIGFGNAPCHLGSAAKGKNTKVSQLVKIGK